MVEALGQRADAVRSGAVDASQDNMLLITNDGRKLALDQRLLNPLLPDMEGSKVNVCAEKVYQIWKDTQKDRLTQLVFCDLSTPKTDGSFSVYNELKDKLVARWDSPGGDCLCPQRRQRSPEAAALWESPRRGRCGYCWAAPPKWEPEPTSRTGSSPSRS